MSGLLIFPTIRNSIRNFFLPAMEILYEDNHLIAINKSSSELVQGDETGDISLDITLKDHLKEKYNKPGNVFLGVVHRLDRPVTGVVLFAKTGKALSRLNKLFRDQEISKTYWAIVKNKPVPSAGELTHYLTRNTKQNKSYAHAVEVSGSKIAMLRYRTLISIGNYHLLEIDLLTGRHHQIRCQLAKINSPVKGDLKYGFPRPNPDAGINLHAREIRFIHPVRQEEIKLTAPIPDQKLWEIFQDEMGKSGLAT